MSPRKWLLALPAALLTAVLTGTQAQADTAPTGHAVAATGVQAHRLAAPVVPSVVPSVTPSGVAKPQATCWFGACYEYASAAQVATNGGASVTTTVQQPELDRHDSSAHSLQELAVMTTDRAFIVEIGWIIYPGLNGDSAPHLFVYHWVNNGESCYNGCGFVSTTSAAGPGMALTPNTSVGLAIQSYSGNWWLSYNGTWIGYFPGSLWNNAYSQANEIQAFGEVSSTSGTTCTDMGNGRWGSDGASSSFSNLQLLGSTASPSWGVSQTDPSHYTVGSATKTSFHLGGPGSGSCG